MLDRRQKIAKAAAVRSSACLSPTSRAKTSGAATKRFLTHWWGRMDFTAAPIMFLPSLSIGVIIWDDSDRRDE